MKKLTSKILLAGLVALGLLTSVMAEEWETINLNKSSEGRNEVWTDEAITLEKGDRLDVVQVLKSRNSSGELLIYKIWLNPDDDPIKDHMSIQMIKSINPMTLYGPCDVKFGIYYFGKQSSITLKITRAEESSTRASRYALVLPEGAESKHKIIMESSTDLVNWTEDSLGSKDSSDNKRFYRLRAVKE